MCRKIVAILVALVLTHGVFAAAYLLRFPAWRAPDEGAHFAYIQHLHHEGQLPIFYGKHRGTYEAHQPPLYYLTALLFVAPFLSTAETPLTALYIARVASALWGVIVVVMAFLLALQLKATTPTALPVAALAGVFAALLPVHLLVCASVGNDAIAGATAATTLVWLCRLILDNVENRLWWRDAAVAGLLCGTALLAKSSNLVLLPLSLVAFLLPDGEASKQPKAQTPLRKSVKSPKRQSEATSSPLSALSLVPFFAAFLLVAGWWLWRNVQLYGDPLGVRAFLEGFRSSPKPSDFLEPTGRYARYGAMSLTTYLMWVTQITFFTWLGIFGEPNEAVKGLARLLEGTEPSKGWVILAMLIGCGLLVAIALGSVETCRNCVRALQERRWRIAFAHALPLLLFLLVFAEFVQFNYHFFQAQARYFYPAHAAMAYLFAVGVMRFVPSHWAWQAVLGGAVVMLTLATIVWWQWAGL